MKRFLILWLALYSTLALAGDAVIFDGNYVRALKDQFKLNETAKVLTGTADPSSVATDAQKGSLYLRQTPAGDGALYVKKDDGSSTNWDLVQTTAGPVLTANRAVVTDASGYLAAASTTDTQIGYLSGTTGTTGTNKIVLDTSPTLVTPVLGVATGTSLQLSGLTASKALTTDASKNLTSSSTSDTQLGYLSSATGTTGNTATNLVFSTSPTLVTPALGAATGTSLQLSGLTASKALTTDVSKNLTSSATSDTQLGYLSGATGTTGTTTTNLVFSTSPTLVTPVLGAATGTSLQLSGLTASKALTTDGSKNLTSSSTSDTQLGYLSSATGTTGTTSTNLVFSTSPTLVTPTLGVASATSVNKVAITAPATSATLTLADGSTLATSGAFSTTLTATGATNVTLPTSGTLATNAVVVPGTSNGLVSSSGVPGLTSGGSISAGYIGQKIAATVSDVNMTTGGTFYNLASISLTAGVWMVYAHSRISVGATTEPAQLSISTTSATRDLTNENRAGAVNSGSLYAQLGTVAQITTGSTITVYMVGLTASNSMQSYADSSYFFAIRIA